MFKITLEDIDLTTEMYGDCLSILLRNVLNNPREVNYIFRFINKFLSNFVLMTCIVLYLYYSCPYLSYYNSHYIIIILFKFAWFKFIVSLCSFKSILTFFTQLFTFIFSPVKNFVFFVISEWCLTFHLTLRH